MGRLTFEVHDRGIFVKESDVKTFTVEDEIMHTGNAIRKLAEYEDLEEQRKLLKMPCAVGDTVYRVNKEIGWPPDRVYECKVVGLKQEYNTFSVKLHANIKEETYTIWVNDWFDKCQIGHEFFLTKEEADVALKYRQTEHKQSCKGCICDRCFYKEDCCPDCGGEILGCEEYLETEVDIQDE